MAPRKDKRDGDPAVFRLLGTSLLALAVGISLLSCEKKEELKAQPEVVRPVKLMTIVAEKAALNRSLPGRVLASKRVELAFQIEGTLIELPVQEGQTVNAGDHLARLDPRDFESALQDALGQVEKAQALLRLTAVELDRLVRVRTADPGAVAQSHVDHVRERKAMAQADLTSARAALATAKLRLSYTYLRAPFSGVISSRAVDNHQEVRAKQTILALDDLAVMEVLVEVPESMMAPVRELGSYDFYAEFAPAPGKKYPLSLKEFSTRGDPRTLTYQVTYQMDQPKEGIRVLPGMTANVLAEPKHDAISSPVVIPAVALYAEQGKAPHVWVVGTGSMTVSLREVKTGNLVGSGSIEVVEGLKTGEIIAVSAVTHLREGMKIRKFE